jgi:hypothetical protein
MRLCQEQEMSLAEFETKDELVHFISALEKVQNGNNVNLIKVSMSEVDDNPFVNLTFHIRRKQILLARRKRFKLHVFEKGQGSST